MHLSTSLPHETYLKWGIYHSSTQKLKMWWFCTESADLIPASRLLFTYLLLSSCITNAFLSSLPDFTVNGWFLMSLLSCWFLWSMKIICRTVHSATEIQVDYWRKPAQLCTAVALLLNVVADAVPSFPAYTGQLCYSKGNICSRSDHANSKSVQREICHTWVALDVGLAYSPLFNWLLSVFK